jgi:hypothetical protein
MFHLIALIATYLLVEEARLHSFGKVSRVIPEQ